MKDEIELNKARITMYANNPEMLQTVAKPVVQYFKQLEKHIGFDDDDRLFKMVAIPNIADDIKSLETLLPKLMHGSRIERTHASILYLRLQGLIEEYYKKEFPDFEQDFNTEV